jgi:hypothetical protein
LLAKIVAGECGLSIEKLPIILGYPRSVASDSPATFELCRFRE